MSTSMAHSEQTRKRHARRRAELEAEIGVGVCGVPGCANVGCAIRFGECHCGCRERTNLAPQTSKSTKIVFGKPYLYVVGHNLRESVMSPREGGRLLEEARRARGLSQKALERLSGASSPTLSRLEGGVVPRVSSVKACAIADALGCAVEELFTEEVPPVGDRPRRRPATVPQERYDGAATKRAAEEDAEGRRERGLLTRGEAAKLLRVDPAQVTHYTAKGLLEPAERVALGAVRVTHYRKSDVEGFEREWARTLTDDGRRRYWLDPEVYVEQMTRQGYVARLAERHGVTEEDAEAIYRDRAVRRRHQVVNRRRGRRKSSGPPWYHAEWAEQLARVYDEFQDDYRERVELGIAEGDKPPTKFEAAAAVAEQSYQANPELWRDYRHAPTDPHALHPDLAVAAANRVWTAVKPLQIPHTEISST